MNKLTRSAVEGVLSRAAALCAVTIVPGLGCGSNGSQNDDATRSAQATSSESADLRSAHCAKARDAADPSWDDPVAVIPASDCGALSTTACRVVTAFSGTFNDLQTAIDQAIDGDVLTVTGHCGAATVEGRTGLMITGPFPFGGCGFNGPTGTQLRGTIDGLTVSASTNITVRFLNFVNAPTGLLFDSSITSSASCICAAHNTGPGVFLLNTQAATVSQVLAEANDIGIQGTGTQTVIFGNSRVTGNAQGGMLFEDSSNDVVASNIVTNNAGFGIRFVNVVNTIATANVINNNGDELVNIVSCIDSHLSGSNVPPSCF